MKTEKPEQLSHLEMLHLEKYKKKYIIEVELLMYLKLNKKSLEDDHFEVKN